MAPNVPIEKFFRLQGVAGLDPKRLKNSEEYKEFKTLLN